MKYMGTRCHKVLMQRNKGRSKSKDSGKKGSSSDKSRRRVEIQYTSGKPGYMKRTCKLLEED